MLKERDLFISEGFEGENKHEFIPPDLTSVHWVYLTKRMRLKKRMRLTSRSNELLMNVTLFCHLIKMCT